MSDNLILCYCVAVKKQLHAETLTRALHQLAIYNEMLQVRLEGGKYVPEPEPHEPRCEILSVYDCAGKSAAEVEALIRVIVKDLGRAVECRRGASIRAALLGLDQGVNRLLLLSHRAIVDQRGLVLILEDLFRIYEQLSNGREVALRPAGKTYPEFISEIAAGRPSSVMPKEGPIRISNSGLSNWNATERLATR
jgi:Condensation domain